MNRWRENLGYNFGVFSQLELLIMLNFNLTTPVKRKQRKLVFDEGCNTTIFFIYV